MITVMERVANHSFLVPKQHKEVNTMTTIINESPVADESTAIVASPGVLSTVLRHPVTRITGLVASYVGAATAGWYFGKKIEAAYAKRAMRTSAASNAQSESVRHTASQHAEN